MSPARPATTLPVSPALPRVAAALREAGVAVLVAPPGSGKTTLVPLALLSEVTGRIVVAQPRRIAARAAARGIARLLGEPVGETVGYAVRGERRSGPRTRIEVVTTGLQVRRLQHDPELPGTAVVILDEVHERHLDADLALAFTIDARSALRPDLRVLAMSATPRAEELAALLGGEAGSAPVIRVAGHPHPVTVVWSPPPGPITPPHGLRVDDRLLDHVAATVRRALAEQDGDLLVFLPGNGELARVAQRLADLRDRVELYRLHGRLASGEQDAVFRPATRRRVVLATAVAESSVTVPGVRVVVDAGLSRVPRTDHGRGLDALVTVPVSRAGAAQRAGRAAREGPGVVYRCWSAVEHERLPAHPEPEIAVADLTGFALQLAEWGYPDGVGLALPEPPPPAALTLARLTLATLGAVGPDGRVTDRGRAIAATGVHPRLARALLDGARLVGADRAAEVVALLAGDEATGTDDLASAWRRLRSGTDPVVTRRWREEVTRLRGAVPVSAGPPPEPVPDDLAIGLVVGLAHPERLARLRRPDGRTYLMAGGTAARLADGSALTGSHWLAIAVADRGPGRAEAGIRLAVPIDAATAARAAGELLRQDREVLWSNGDVVARRVHRLGAVVISEGPLTDPDPTLVQRALRDGLQRDGLTLLDWTPTARSLRERVAFCRHALGEPWPDVSDEALLSSLDEWLGPDLTRARCRSDLGRIDVTEALRRLLPWPAAARLDELAPERLTVPSGSRVRVDYRDPGAPVLAVKLQETFGWTTTPRLADGRVPVLLHLLSPAGRPAAVTADLTSFWRSGYPRVRAELRGRYPRHPWPQQPATAVPTRQPQSRRERSPGPS